MSFCECNGDELIFENYEYKAQKVVICETCGKTPDLRQINKEYQTINTQNVSRGRMQSILYHITSKIEHL